MKQIINVPFPGFYYTWYDQEIDHEMENAVDGYIESDRRDIPKELREEVLDIFQSNFRLNVCHNRICADYIKAFNEWFEDKYELDLELEFESMSSPKYYNFETDRLFATIDEAKVQALFDLARPKLDAEIKRRFTSRDGFISHYSNDLADWPKHLNLWDHNELGTLLTALFSHEENHDWEVFEMIYEDSTFSEAFHQAMQWRYVDDCVHELLIDRAREEGRKEGLREYEEQLHDDARVFPGSRITNVHLYVQKYEELNHLRGMQ